MDRSGYAFPGLSLIAKGARTSTRTVQRHIAMAKSEGWLGITMAGRGGQGWRHNAYRAAVPDHIPLEELDEAISVHIADLEETGDEDRGDIIVSSPSVPPVGKLGERHMCPWDGLGMSLGQTSKRTGRDDNDTGKVTTSDIEGHDSGSQNVATQLCRTNSRSETLAYRTHTQEQAHNAQSRVMRAVCVDEQDRKEKSQKAREEVAQVREPVSRLKQISDDDFHKYVLKLKAAGITSADEILKLFGPFQDITIDRVQRVIDANRGTAVFAAEHTNATASGSTP